jgi:hypothetical protein
MREQWERLKSEHCMKNRAMEERHKQIHMGKEW